MRKRFLYETKFAIIEIPSREIGRFVLLPSVSHNEKRNAVGRCDCLYSVDIFSYFMGYMMNFRLIVLVTKDAEFDLDNDIKTTLAEKI